MTLPHRRPLVTLAIVAGTILAATAMFGSPAKTAELLDAATLASELGGHSITGYYTRDAVAFVEIYLKDGGIDYKDTRGADTGNWSLQGDSFCTYYKQMTGACWYVVKQKPDCYEFYNARDFPEGVPPLLQDVLKQTVAVRAARDGGKLTCDPWVGA